MKRFNLQNGKIADIGAVVMDDIYWGRDISDQIHWLELTEENAAKCWPHVDRALIDWMIAHDLVEMVPSELMPGELCEDLTAKGHQLAGTEPGETVSGPWFVEE